MNPILYPVTLLDYIPQSAQRNNIPATLVLKAGLSLPDTEFNKIIILRYAWVSRDFVCLM